MKLIRYIVMVPIALIGYSITLLSDLFITIARILTIISLILVKICEKIKG